MRESARSSTRKAQTNHTSITMVFATTMASYCAFAAAPGRHSRLVALFHGVVVLPQLGDDLPRLTRHPGLVPHPSRSRAVFGTDPLGDSLRVSSRGKWRRHRGTCIILRQATDRLLIVESVMRDSLCPAVYLCRGLRVHRGEGAIQDQETQLTTATGGGSSMYW